MTKAVEYPEGRGMMTDAEINVAITEACGTLSWSYALPVKTLSCDVPKYSEDLNAMHEAEKTLSLDQRHDYWQWLARITEEGRMAEASWLTTTATALQRAEAFLRCLGRWRES